MKGVPEPEPVRRCEWHPENDADDCQPCMSLEEEHREDLSIARYYEIKYGSR